MSSFKINNPHSSRVHCRAVMYKVLLSVVGDVKVN